MRREIPRLHISHPLRITIDDEIHIRFVGAGSHDRAVKPETTIGRVQVACNREMSGSPGNREEGEGVTVTVAVAKPTPRDLSPFNSTHDPLVCCTELAARRLQVVQRGRLSEDCYQ